MTTSPITDSDGLTITRKRELLAKILRHRSDDGTSHRPSRWRLSYGQRAMWFMHLLEPTATAFNIGEAVVLRGKLDRDALRRALARLAERHPVLCTRMGVDESGEPYQEEIPADHLRLSEVDASDWPEQRLLSTLRADIDRPFELTAGPLLRLTLYRRGAEEHVALLSLHHIVGEFWTLVILVGDLAALYDAETTATEPGLPPVERHYSHFASWQREMLAGAEGERLWRYWQQVLRDEPQPLRLPTDRPRPPARSFNGALHGFRLDADIACRLREFTRATGATAYQIMLAVFGVFLQRHTGQRDLLVGSPMTGRQEAHWSRVSGYFDNPLPVRMKIDARASFADTVSAVRAAALGAFAHQAMPFPLLVQRLGVRADPGRSPLFDVMFVLRKAQSPGMSGLAAMAMGARDGTSMMFTSELEAISLELPRTVSQYDLTLSLAESPDGMDGSWEYNTDLFDSATIELFSTRFARLALELLSAPHLPVTEVPVLSAGEWRRVVEEWNDTAAPLPADHRLHGGFVAMAAAKPAAEAVVADGVRLKYGELDRHTDTIAGWLQRAGAGPGKLVGIYMHKGWQQIAAAVGVVKCGAAYLPIDAGLPSRRVAELLRLGEVEQVLVQPATAGELPSDFGGAVFVVAEDTLTAGAMTPRAVDIEPNQLAYVIFTSGSTGTPKGVMIDHLGATNTVHDINTRFGAGPDDRVLALSSLSFDLSVYDIFGTLAAGGTIVVPSTAAAREPAHWLELVRSERVTIWNSVPALAQLAADEAGIVDPQALASVRLTMLSGDWIPLGLPDQLRQLRPGMHVHSLGGATEASIWSIGYPIAEVDPQWTSIPYGRPLANQRFHVLGEGDQPCGPGVIGQLHIGGVGLAHGYWRDERRTAQRFFEHPELGRLYRTGDLGRYGPDGCIEFLGREDHQVKIRGYRVELGEVEAALREQPGVRDAVVLAVGAREARRLVGFALAPPEVVDRLREHCLARLPGYMVPAVLIGLSQFPLTGNGKVDHAALTRLAGQVRPGSRDNAEPTEDSRHELICRILAELLGVPAVRATDDFFRLGGDSVTAIRLCAAARRGGLALSPDQVFANPTVGQMVAVSRSVTPRLTPETPSPAGQRELGLTPMQRTMLLHATVGQSPRLYCEQVRVRIAGGLDPDILRAAWQQVVDRHPALRVRFAFDPDGRPVQQVGTQEVTIDVVDLREAGPGERDRVHATVLEADRDRGFDRLDRPLTRWMLVRLSDVQHELVWTHHHLLLDGWSLTVVLEEVLMWYAALLANDSPATAEPPRHDGYLARLDDDGIRQAAEAFWRSTLDGLTGPTRLPREIAAGAQFRHAEEELRLTAEQTALLTAASAGLGVTVNSLLQCAWALTLFRWTGDQEVVFGVTTTGRTADVDGIESMVGMFINTVPLRVPVDPAAQASAWLRDVQSRQAAATAHDCVPLADVERWSGLPRRAGEMALFDSVVVFENYPTPERLTAEGAGLVIEDVRFTEVTEAPMTLYALPGAHFAIRAAFDAAAWHPATVRDRLTLLRTLLLGLAENAQRPIGAILASATAAYGDALMKAGELTSPVEPIVELIARAAGQRPGHPAVRYGQSEMDYGTLVASARVVAERLVARGARPDTVVGVMLPRGIDAVTTILAVLFSGAGYVPIDPDQPGARVADMLRRADPSIVVTRASHADKCAMDRPLVLLDDLPSRPGPVGPPTRADDDRDLAYVIYTSGSTGEPHGVAVDRGALAHFVAAALDRYRIGPHDRVLQFAPLQFDASVEEIFVTLCAGGTLVVRTEEMLSSPAEFLRHCAEFDVTVLDLPTAFWHVLVEEIASGAAALPSTVHTVIIGGEAVRMDVVDRWRAAVPPHIRLINTYGPTEATVVATSASLGGTP